MIILFIIAYIILSVNCSSSSSSLSSSSSSSSLPESSVVINLEYYGIGPIREDEESIISLPEVKLFDELPIDVQPFMFKHINVRDFFKTFPLVSKAWYLFAVEAMPLILKLKDMSRHGRILEGVYINLLMKNDLTSRLVPRDEWLTALELSKDPKCINNAGKQIRLSARAFAHIPPLSPVMVEMAKRDTNLFSLRDLFKNPCCAHLACLPATLLLSALVVYLVSLNSAWSAIASFPGGFLLFTLTIHIIMLFEQLMDCRRRCCHHRPDDDNDDDE